MLPIVCKPGSKASSSDEDMKVLKELSESYRKVEETIEDLLSVNDQNRHKIFALADRLGIAHLELEM